MTDYGNVKAKLWLSLAIVALFVAFLICTIHGLLLYSGNYGIKHIDCNQTFRNELFLIDHDMKTTWGLTEEHHWHEMIYIHFRTPRCITGIDVLNAEYMTEKTPSMMIFTAENGLDWVHISPSSYEETNEKDITRFIFHEPLTACQHISLAYMDEDDGFWPVSEVVFYDEEM